MNDNFNILCRHFQEEDIQFEPHPELHSVTVNLELRNTNALLAVCAPPDGDLFAFVLFVPVRIPPERRSAVGEFLHRFNFIVHVGGFQLDYDNGQARFAVHTLPVPDLKISPEMFRVWLGMAVNAVDAAYAALMRVAFGAASPAHAFEQAEALYGEYNAELAQPEE